MKKSQKANNRRMLPIAMIVGLALVATGWYWGEIRGFYEGTLQAAAAFLGL